MKKPLTPELLTYWNEIECRAVQRPDGSIDVLPATRSLWASFDFLVVHFGYTEARLLELAILDAVAQGKTLAQNFHNTIAYLDQELRRAECAE